MSKSLKISDISKENVFKTPSQYFEKLPEDIWQKIKLSEGVQLQEIPHHQVFTTPPQYFEQLSVHIQQRVALIEDLSLTQVPPHLVFTTPPKYFEELTVNITQKIQLLEGQTSQLVPKVEVFSTPDRYFEDLASQIQHRVTSQKTFWKRPGITQPVFELSPFLRYAGAFMFVLLMVFTGIWFFDKPSDNNRLTAQQGEHQMCGNQPNLMEGKTIRHKPVNDTTQKVTIEKNIAQNTPPKTVQRTPAIKELDLSSLSEKEMSVFLADVGTQDLDVLEETLENEEQAVETFLLNALESNRDLLFEHLKDIDLKAIQNIKTIRK